MFEYFTMKLKTKDQLITQFIVEPIMEAYNESIKKFKDMYNYSENKITEKIVYNLINNTSISQLYDNKTIEISYRPHEIRTVDEINEPDIKITITNAIRLEMEAKRLHEKTNWSEKEYLGSDGLDRFLTGYYAGTENYGGLLCYIQNGDYHKIFLKIEAELKKKNNPIVIKSDQNDRIIVSTHTRDNKPRIRLYHTFLEFNKN